MFSHAFVVVVVVVVAVVFVCLFDRLFVCLFPPFSLDRKWLLIARYLIFLTTKLCNGQEHYFQQH